MSHPQPLALQLSGEVADNWKLWMKRYNNYFAISRFLLGIKYEQTTKKILRIRDLALNRCIDICCREEITALHMKSLSEQVDNINKVKSEEKKPRVLILVGKENLVQVLWL